MSAYRFKVGDRVTVKHECVGGNPRTPSHVRGRSGVVVEIHGQIENPLDHRGIYPPLYTLAFDVGDVFGGASTDKLCVDVHEEWLD